MGEATRKLQRVGFAAGCFWGKEYHLRQQPGVVSTRVGYTGGHTEKPTYHEVCRKTTGHAETVEVTYDLNQTTFAELCRFFFEMHDPTIDRRDKGGQYRSAIFFTTPDQAEKAIQLMDQLKAQGYVPTTQLESLEVFWPAEERHQSYCERTGLQPRDHYTPRFSYPSNSTT
jgi:peptide methionine sulfoxide reductase msrA/msrB